MVPPRIDRDHPRSRGVYNSASNPSARARGSSPLARGLPSEWDRLTETFRIIPARAGFTSGRWPGTPASRDHPRSRGVYGEELEERFGIKGSSPLARGLLLQGPEGVRSRRIIPARSGFTPRPESGSSGASDHPRSRGVYAQDHGQRRRQLGSSPLARGLRRPRAARGGPRRIIPARAGFTRELVRLGGAAGDHPRSRGVYVTGGLVVALNRGSSPLARGLLIQTPRLGYFDADHPRSRGVYASPSATFAMEVGSSPLARGLQEHDPQRDLAARIIPARAGFTEPRSPTSRPLGDHPRSRGVYPPCLKCMIIIHGSSPLARGLPREVGPEDELGGIIPARAGFTRRPTTLPTTSRDHPRSRGVYEIHPATKPSMDGSSPLARGLRPGGWWMICPGGIIPARAGFTPLRSARWDSSWDHPRSRGVYVEHASGGPDIVRIIPARAGFTCRRADTGSPAPDHPRSRGVYHANAVGEVPADGSSPLARGLPLGRSQWP